MDGTKTRSDDERPRGANAILSIVNRRGERLVIRKNSVSRMNSDAVISITTADLMACSYRGNVFLRNYTQSEGRARAIIFSSGLVRVAKSRAQNYFVGIRAENILI